MKIVIATPLYPPDIGGPATYAKVLEDELPKRGVDVVVVSFHTVRHLPKGLSHLAYLIKLFRAARGADVLLALDPVSVGFPAALVSLVRGKKFVVKIVGDYAWEQGRQRFSVSDNLDDFVKKPASKFVAQVAALRRVQEFVAARARTILVPSKYLKGIVGAWGVPPQKIEVVYNTFGGIADLPSKEEIRATLGLNGTVLLTAGRLVPWKGFVTLIQLFPEIIKTHPDAKLYIAGTGPDEKELSTLVRQSGLTDNILLLGNVEHRMLMEFIRAADCFVLNTGYEGLSHQLLEVLAVGTPIVTTNVGGNPELVEHGVTGLLVPHDDRDALLVNIRRILDEPVLAADMTMKGKDFVASFTIERMVADTLDVLSKVNERP